MAGCVEGIRRALVQGRVLIAGTAIEQAPSIHITIVRYIESNTNEKLDHFLIELQNIDLTTKLNHNPFSNPSKNYDTFINILTNIKQRVLPKTMVKFNKRKIKISVDE